MERQGEGSGVRVQGEGQRRGRKHRNRRKDSQVAGWKEAEDEGTEGGQAWGAPGLGGLVTGSAPCSRGGSWVWACKPAGVCPSRKSASQPASLSSPSGTCTGISSSTQGECSSRSIKMHRNVSSLPASQAPASATPSPWVIKTVPLNLFLQESEPQEARRKCTPTPLLPSPLSSLLLLLPSPLPPFPSPFPSWVGGGHWSGRLLPRGRHWAGSQNADTPLSMYRLRTCPFHLRAHGSGSASPSPLSARMQSQRLFGYSKHGLAHFSVIYITH